MRAVQISCWLLAAIYLFAALGSAVASGHELAVQLAVSLPAVLVAGPVAVGRAAECAADAAVAAVIGESAEWEDIVAAWCEGFMDDAREEALGFGKGSDRRGSNGHGHQKEAVGAVIDDWERQAGWIKTVEVLQRRGDITPYTTALRQKGICRYQFIDV